MVHGGLALGGRVPLPVPHGRLRDAGGADPAPVGYDVVQDLQGAFQAAAATSAFQALFFKTVSGDVVNTGDLVFKGSTCVTLTLNLPPPRC